MKWRELILRNLWWKVFSLLIAVIVWSTYHISGGTFGIFGALYEDTTPMVFPNYRPRVLTRQGDLHQYKLHPGEVTVTVAGRRAAMLDVNVREIVVFVDVQDFLVGGTNLLPVHVRTPPGVSRFSVTPERVEVTRREPEPLPGN